MSRTKSRYRKKKNTSFESLESILGSSFKTLGLDIKLKEHQAITDWDHIVGKQIAMVTNPSHMRFKELFVNVSNHIWMQQLTFMEEAIIQKINTHMGQKLIKKIYFRLGQVDNNKSV